MKLELQREFSVSGKILCREMGFASLNREREVFRAPAGNGPLNNNCGTKESIYESRRGKTRYDRAGLIRRHLMAWGKGSDLSVNHLIGGWMIMFSVERTEED